MNCEYCDSLLAEHMRYCPVCKTDGGIPNIRIAKSEEEKSALARRYADAIVSINARNCQNKLEKFEEAVKTSQAVICRDLILVNQLVSGDNELYINFHLQVESGSRLPEDNMWDQGRLSVQNSLFPNFSRDISIAALSLDCRGLENYGQYNIILKENIVNISATVFEENPFHFMARHKVITGEQIPFGYRAIWEERHKLATAKVHSELDESTTEEDFPSIILSPGSTTEDDRFIEVHIYGGIHRKAIRKVVGPKAKGSYRALGESVKRKLEECGAAFEEI